MGGMGYEHCKDHGIGERVCHDDGNWAESCQGIVLLVGFPASKEGNRFLIHVEAANEWLRKRAIAKVGVETASLKRVAP